MEDLSSVLSVLKSYPRDSVNSVIDTLDPELQEALCSYWPLLARPEQLPPGHQLSAFPTLLDWFIWLIKSGRGWGKTRTGAETVIEWAKEQGGGVHIAICGPTAADNRDTLVSYGKENVDGASGILAVSPGDFRPIYEPSKRVLTWPNGSQATTYSAEEPQRLRGPQHHKAWCDELAAWKYIEETWNMLMFGLRLGAKPQVVITTTPRPLPLIKKLIKRPDCVVTNGSSHDNKANLSKVFYDTVIKVYLGTRLGRQEVDGEILDDNPGALFQYANIEPYRVPHITNLRRIVVAIDPATTSKPESDDTSIIVAGTKRNVWKPGDEKILDNAMNVDHGYILEEVTGKFSPKQWGEKSIELYRKWKADRIVAEVNNGGDLVESNIRSIDSRVSYVGVHASKGKAIRAEPVSALYERGMVHHVGNFKMLEDEITTWDPSLNMASPNRLDALVWALTELMLDDEPKPTTGGYRGSGSSNSWKGY